VGALAPSSVALARSLAGEIHAPSRTRTLELGAGTGVTTRALLACGVSPANLTVVERDAFFCRRLTDHFPDVCVIEGDARHLRHCLDAARMSVEVDVVISSLPLLSLGPSLQFEILTEIAEVLAPGGLLVQFTYGHGVPVHSSIMKRLHWTADRVRTVWRNLPPATVWRMQPAAKRVGAQQAA
jgi:phosphatidylethanolamine/phosphatidyl-N-methylethanolamine N-methyltransferase